MAAPRSSVPQGAAETRAPVMRRVNGAESGALLCEDFPSFRPNLSPGEVLRAGAFGGTYFRNIEIEDVSYRDAWKEFAPPSTDWFSGLDIKMVIASPKYRSSVNKYKVKCGQSLDEWLKQGWIKTDFDSHGWFHWYAS
jgi:hypothetical protein